MEDRIAVLTAEINSLKEQLRAEQRLTEIYKQGKNVGDELNAIIKGLSDSGLDEEYIKTIVKTTIKQGLGNGGCIL